MNVFSPKEQKMTIYCTKYKKVAFSQTGPRDAIFSRLRCKQWSCDFCAAKNASIWRAFLKEKLPTVSDDWYLITLTANPSTRTRSQSLHNIRSNIDRMVKRIRRVFGDVEYVRTYEKHPTSEAIHAHIIMTGLTPYVAVGCSSKLQPMAIPVTTRTGRNGVWAVKTWFKKTSWETGMGYICDVQRITGDVFKCIWYVTKYLTKSQQDMHEKGLRHVQTTRGIGSPKDENDLVWTTAAYIIPKMFPAGTRIDDLNTGFVIDNNYWEQTGFYPSED